MRRRRVREREPLVDPVRPPVSAKAKLCGSFAGTVTLSTTILPRFAFVKVQVTVSPAARAIEPGSEPSSHVADWRSQPAGTVSETEYVPAASGPESFDCPSDSEKPSRRSSR